MASEMSLEGLYDQVSELLNRKLSKALKRELAKNIVQEIKVSAAPVLKERLLKAYDVLAEQEKGEFGPAIAGKDPSALENFRDVFAAQIDKELSQIRVEGDSIVIEVGNKDAWGLGRTEAPTGPLQTVDFLGFYIEGVAGEFGFISIDQYSEFRGRVPNSLGRFGGGFLITREKYVKEKWDRGTGLSFEDIKHPISGQRPYRGFNQALESFDFSPYISKAVKDTFDQMGKSIV